jgi:hypothetical protein
LNAEVIAVPLVKSLTGNKRRDWLYRKLEKVMDTIENEDLPMHIKEVYVFGSFLKGKESPRDVDIVLIYDSNLTTKKYETIGKKGIPRWKMWELRKSPSKLRGRLKENAENTIDLTICPSIEEFQRDLTKELDLCLRIWSVEDRDWRSNLRNRLTISEKEA